MIGTIIWLIGAYATFRIWTYRFPPEYHKIRSDFGTRHSEKDGWYVHGWTDGLAYEGTGGLYTSTQAAVACLTLWPIIGFVTLVKMPFQTHIRMDFLFPNQKKTKKKLKAASVSDKYEKEAKEEVDKLYPM